MAAAGIGAGVGERLGAHFTQGEGNRFAFGERLLTNTATGLANAATRSLIEGSDFGDNIIAALPDVIGQTVGGYLADGIAERQQRVASARSVPSLNQGQSGTTRYLEQPQDEYGNLVDENGELLPTGPDIM